MQKGMEEKLRDRLESGINRTSESDLEMVVESESKIWKLSNHFKKCEEQVRLLWNLLADYKAKRYTEVPWRLIAAIIFSFTYLLCPVDLIPDVLPVIGFSDDITVFVLIFAGFSAELDNYKNWKQCHLALPDTVSDEAEQPK